MPPRRGDRCLFCTVGSLLRSDPDTTKPPEGGFAPTAVGLTSSIAYERTIPGAVAAKVVGVEMVDFTESPPFKVDGTFSLAQRKRAVNRDAAGDIRAGPSGQGARGPARRPSFRARHPLTVEARKISSIEAASAASNSASLIDRVRPSVRAREKLAIMPRLLARRRQASARV